MHNPPGRHSKSLRTPPVRTILRAVRSAGSASVGARALALLRGPGKRGVKIRHNKALPGSGLQRAGRRWFGRSVRGIDANACNNLMLNGIKREQGRPAADPRLPITPVILRQLRALWRQTPHRWDSTMLWAACTVETQTLVASA